MSGNSNSTDLRVGEQPIETLHVEMLAEGFFVKEALGPVSAILWTIYRGTKFNFRPENFDWLYCLFSPWQDFVINYDTKGQNYNLICLGWGEDEGFIGSKLRGGGTLPRAKSACTDDQVALTQEAVDSKSKNNILLTHFTFASYDQTIPFVGGKAEASINIKNFPITQKATLGKHDIGSFYENRTAMYQFLLDGDVKYSISDHSHRAGAYTYSSLKETGYLGSRDIAGTIGKEDILNLKPNYRLAFRSLVCGASGPFSYKNIKGELGGYGMDCPQGFILDVPGNTLKWEKDSHCVQNKKPRLAVVMEYLWYEGKCRPFCAYADSDYESSIRRDSEGNFYFQLSEEFKKIFLSEENYETVDKKVQPKIAHPFAETTLIALCKKGVAVLPMYPAVKKVNDTDSFNKFTKYPLRLGGGGLDAFIRKIDLSGDLLAHFFSIKFTDVPGVVNSRDYDFEKAWCFPVKIEPDYKRIYRPKENKGGELPSHSFYDSTWPKEYNLPKK